MVEFDVQRCTRKCAKTERELRPGEVLYSALLPQGDSYQRVDFAAEGWEGPPPEAIAWWKSAVPGAVSAARHWAPNDVLLEYFRVLQDDPARADVRYVLALLLVRRRIARWEQSTQEPGQPEMMILYCPKEEREYQVPVCDLSAERVAEIQDELTRLLVTPAAG